MKNFNEHINILFGDFFHLLLFSRTSLYKKVHIKINQDKGKKISSPCIAAFLFILLNVFVR